MRVRPPFRRADMELQIDIEWVCLRQMSPDKHDVISHTLEFAYTEFILHTWVVARTRRLENCLSICECRQCFTKLNAIKVVCFYVYRPLFLARLFVWASAAELTSSICNCAVYSQLNWPIYYPSATEPTNATKHNMVNSEPPLDTKALLVRLRYPMHAKVFVANCQSPAGY